MEGCVEGVWRGRCGCRIQYFSSQLLERYERLSDLSLKSAWMQEEETAASPPLSGGMRVIRKEDSQNYYGKAMLLQAAVWRLLCCCFKFLRVFLDIWQPFFATPQPRARASAGELLEDLWGLSVCVVYEDVRQCSPCTLRSVTNASILSLATNPCHWL